MISIPFFSPDLYNASISPTPPPQTTIGAPPQNLNLPLTRYACRPKLGMNLTPLSFIQRTVALLFLTRISHKSGSVRCWVMRAMSSKNSFSVYAPKSLEAISSGVRSGANAMMSSAPLYAKRIFPSVYELLPPRSDTGARSSNSTLAPCSRAERAAQRAAFPPPTTITSYLSCSIFVPCLIALDAGCLYDLFPLGYFSANKFRELIRGAPDRFEPVAGKPLSDFRHLHYFYDLRAQDAQHVFGNAGGSKKSIP